MSGDTQLSSEVQAVVDKIAEMTEQIKSLSAGTLGQHQLDQMTADFKALLDEHKTAVLDSTPVRPGEFQSSAIQRAASGYTGKYARELSDIANHGEHRIGNWRLRGTDMILAKLILDKANNMKQAGIAFDGQDKIKPASDDLVSVVKLLTSTAAGAGDELVPTGMATELWQDFFAASRIVGDLPTQPMPTDPFDVSLGLGTITFRKGGQGQAPAGQNPTTAKSTLTSTELVANVEWSYNLDEDAVIAMMPGLRQQFIVDGSEVMDAFVLNADATATATGNINRDDGTPDADAYYLTDGQDGIRHLPIVDNTGQVNSGGGDALVDADVVGMLADLDKYGLDPSQCRIVPGIGTYFKMLGLTNVATVDKYGPAATIVRGELGRYQGVPILPSASMPLTEADYKVSATAGNNTLGQMVSYNRNFWKVGFKRGLLIEVDRSIQTRKLIMVVSFRIAAAAHGTRSTTKHTALVGNFTI